MVGVKLSKIAIASMAFSLILATFPTDIGILSKLSAWGFISGFFGLFIGLIVVVLRDEDVF